MSSCYFPSTEERGRGKRKGKGGRDWTEERKGEGRDGRNRGEERKRQMEEGERNGQRQGALAGCHGLYFQSTTKVLVLKVWSSTSFGW